MADARTTRLTTRLAARASRAVDSPHFTRAVFVLIAANAVLLGAETYSGVVAAWLPLLKTAEYLFLAAFTAEILLRLAAHADRPAAFFRDPWNLFDLAVVTGAFLPLFRENTTVLRLLRLARVLRAARFLPQLRVVIVAVGKSLPGTLSFLLVGGLLLYVYAMVGWTFFADDDPEHFGSLGRAALTLFLLITLDGLGDAVRTGLEISRWTIVYFASFVLFGSFLLVNLLIGVVIGSLDEARREAEADGEPPRPPSVPAVAPVVPVEPLPLPLLRARIAAARTALDEAERALTQAAPAGATGPPGERVAG
ncbi:ion transporter [Streptomyces albidoflavus]|uniref:Ion transporter n=1 Tax=Streptomyces albidoflavus TaxID=1886 RepID=A0ABY3GZV1_9ACTN|nr:ion transporter [Streptomyces albidoflavus]TWV25780.1 ion transporter [Streptomyces albidoflavus]